MRRLAVFESETTPILRFYKALEDKRPTGGLLRNICITGGYSHMIGIFEAAAKS
jgi:hypothetical protein